MNAEALKILEIIGLLAGVMYVIGAILEKKWCWYAGIAAVILYGIQVFEGKLYGEFVLQIFYLIISFYGLYQWRNSQIQNDILDLEASSSLKVSYSSLSFLAKVSLAGALLSALLYFGLVYLESTYPFWDAITSGFGVTTTYLTAKKKIDNWIFWIVIDLILSIIMFLKAWPFYAVLYLIYALFAILGWWKWHSEHKKNLANIV